MIFYFGAVSVIEYFFLVLLQEVTFIIGALVQSEAGNDDWDDSLITKEEREARLQRKVEAVIKRERAMAYAYSHQVLCLR